MVDWDVVVDIVMGVQVDVVEVEVEEEMLVEDRPFCKFLTSCPCYFLANPNPRQEEVFPFTFI